KVIKQDDGLSPGQQNILAILMRECSTKTAVEMAVAITGARKKLLYQAALELEKAVRT
ncbi:MAG: 16S rRNA (cytidine(1402)-2'-O)-methyltransferase, partial [Methyloglobulus sp.]|nr:16S rRNA (cytidine(1402)-2'-O)-methyltransferase [Methyloglobulus sp.]